jgi:transposase
MPAPLSNDIRRRIIEAREKGDSIKKIAREKGVGVNTIACLLRLYRETGSYAPRPLRNGRKPRLDADTLEKIRARIEKQPDITLRELIEELELPISESGLCKIVNEKLGLRRKKTAFAAQQQRADVAQKRDLWKSHQPSLDASRLVFLDESGVNTAMTRLYGRAQKHQRVREAVPDTRFHRTTILSSVRLDGKMVPCVFEGALNGEIFRLYITQFLVPTLRPGDIVVMDNLSCHKVSGVEEAINSAGATVAYLPPYSPDLNPIELLWSKLKTIMRKLKIRSADLLDDAIAYALSCISASDVAGWFRHDGYYLC